MSTYMDDLVLIQEWVEGSQIALDNVHLRIEGGVGYQLTNLFGRKTLEGEPGPDDHQYNSGNTQRTWNAGQLVKHAQEKADVGKYWRGHAWSQTRGALGHALKVQRVALPSYAPPGPVYPLGRLGEYFYWGVGWRDAHIYQHLEETHSMEAPGGTIRQVQGLITNVGVSFRVPGDTPPESETWMYVPTTDGYTRMSESLETLDITDYATVAFCLNENKLYRLTTTGQVWYLIHHDDAWAYAGIISDDSDPRNMWPDYDDDGNRVVMVSTSSGAWMLDHDNAILWPTDLTFPEHAYQGYGGCSWRADTYLSVGIGVHRKIGSRIDAVGMDGADGLPAPYAGGLIVDLEPSYNWLIAALASEPPPEVVSYTPPPDIDTELLLERYGETHGVPYPLVAGSLHQNITEFPEVFLPDERRGAIFIFNGLGWSEIHTWNRAPTRAIVTMVRNLTRFDRFQHLFWGDVDGGAYTVHIPSTYYNPIESPNLPLDRLSFLEESRIDWDMPDVPKIAKQINIKATNLAHNLVDNQPEPFLNRIQIVCNWTDTNGVDHTSEDPDVLSGPGPYPFSDGVQVLPYLELHAESLLGNKRRAAPIGWERYKNTGVLLPTGLPHEAIWMYYRFIGDLRNDFTGGVIQWRTIVARKWMRPHRIYTFRIDANVAVDGMSETDVLAWLDRITLKVGGVPLVTGDEFRIVDVTTLTGAGEAGLSPRGSRTITCLEFVDETYELPISGPI